MKATRTRVQWVVTVILILAASGLTALIATRGWPAWVADAATFLVQTFALAVVLRSILDWSDHRREARLRQRALRNLLGGAWLAATGWSSPSVALGDVTLDRQQVRKDLDDAIAELDRIANVLDHAYRWAIGDDSDGNLDNYWAEVTVAHFSIQKMNLEGGRNRRHALLNLLADREIGRMISVDSDVELRTLALDLELALTDLFASRQHADSVIGERVLLDLEHDRPGDAATAALITTNPLLLAAKLFERIRQQPLEGPDDSYQLASRCLGALRNEAVKTRLVLSSVREVIDKLARAIDTNLQDSAPAARG
jgi:hypothetical protein